MHISSANYSNQNEEGPEDFQFSTYMIPQRENYNTSYLQLIKQSEIQ